MPGLGFPLYGSLGGDAVAVTEVAGASTVGPPRRSLKVDPITGDLVIEGGQLVFVSGAEAIRQNIQTRLSMFEGEWFLDETAGIPYFRSILIKGANLNAIRGIYRDALLSVPGVIAVDDIGVDFDNPNRAMKIRFAVESDFGTIVDNFTSPLTE